MKDAFGTDVNVGDEVVYIMKKGLNGSIFLQKGTIKRIKKVGANLTAYFDDRCYGGVTSQCIYKTTKE